MNAPPRDQDNFHFVKLNHLAPIQVEQIDIELIRCWAGHTSSVNMQRYIRKKHEASIDGTDDTRTVR